MSRIRFFNQEVKVVPFVSGAGYGFPDLIIGLADDEGKPVPCDIEDIYEAIEELEAGIMESFLGMPIITSPDFMFGAINIIKSRDLLREHFPEGYILIPSSIHEFIVLGKESIGTTEGINDFIKSVNEDVLNPEDVLSDHFYEFN